MTSANGGHSNESIRLRLQGLSVPLQVLAVGALAAMSSDDGTFTTRQIADLLSDLRLPRIANVSMTLSRLKEKGWVMRPAKDVWALTPLGEAKLNTDAGHVPAHALAAGLGQTPGSEFGDQHVNLIPPLLGPMGSSPGLAKMLDKSSFDNNVMLITRFPKDEEDHFSALIPELRKAVAEHGLVLQVSSDAMTEDTLWANVVTYMWACKYAIVLMDKADGVFNSNVLIEVGGMLMTGRRCAILRDDSVPVMPTDLVGHIYKPTDLSDHGAAVAEIHKWIRDDLGLGQCPSCPGGGH